MGAAAFRIWHVYCMRCQQVPNHSIAEKQMREKTAFVGDFRVLAGRFALFLVLAAMWTGQAIASTAGVFQFVVGDVRVVLATGSERPARMGSPVSVGDTIATARASVAQIKMGDGAIVMVQPESRLTVAEFHYTGKLDGSEKVRFRLEQGGIRSVTGAIGHAIRTAICSRRRSHRSAFAAPITKPTISPPPAPARQRRCSRAPTTKSTWD